MNTDLQKDLDQNELNQLCEFLSRSYPKANPMNLNQAHGFITAIASAPNIIMPNNWQPVIFGGIIEFSSIEEAISSITLLQRFYNSILRQLEQPEVFNLFLFEQANPVPLQQASTELIAEWCDAYLQGANMDDLWSNAEAGIDSLYPFALLAGRTSVLGAIDNKGNIIKDDTTYKIKAAKKLSRHIKDIYAAWKIDRSMNFADWDAEEIYAYQQIHYGINSKMTHQQDIYDRSNREKWPIATNKSIH